MYKLCYLTKFVIAVRYCSLYLQELQNQSFAQSGQKLAEKNTITNRLDFAEEFDAALKRSYHIASHDGLLNLRAGAGADKPIIEVMPTGSTVKCYGYHTGDWLYVVSEAGNIGFCNGGYLEKI